MRIAIDGHMLGDHSGGNESYYSNILKNMEVDKKDTVYLFVRKGVDISEYTEKYRVVEFSSNSAFRRYFFELDRLCRKYRVDVLHTQYFIPFIRSCKVVCTIHDICFEHYKGIFKKNEYYRQKILIPYAARHSEYVFTVSENAKDDIARRYNIAKNKIIVTYNAVDKEFRRLNLEELAERELREKYVLGDAPFILTVGNLQPRKNLPRLIKAFREYKEESGSDIKLVIVGKRAWLFEDIIQEAVKEDSNSIVFTDYVEKECLIRLYNAAVAFVYPSFFEGFGIPPLEAMACGTPVAVSNTTSLPEVVGDAGIYFSPFNENEIKCAIKKLLEDKTNNYDKMKARVESFSWKESASVIMRTYKRCEPH